MLILYITLDTASSSNDAREIFALKPQHNVAGQLAIPANPDEITRRGDVLKKTKLIIKEPPGQRKHQP